MLPISVSQDSWMGRGGKHSLIYSYSLRCFLRNACLYSFHHVCSYLCNILILLTSGQVLLCSSKFFPLNISFKYSFEYKYSSKNAFWGFFFNLIPLIYSLVTDTLGLPENCTYWKKLRLSTIGSSWNFSANNGNQIQST